MDLLGILHSQPREVVGVQHFSLLIRCVHEWLCNASPCSDVVLERRLDKVELSFGLRVWFDRMLSCAIERLVLGMKPKEQLLGQLVRAIHHARRWAACNRQGYSELIRAKLSCKNGDA